MESYAQSTKDRREFEPFEVSLPIKRSEFVNLYHQVAFVAKILLAPFGIYHYSTEIIGQQRYLELYSPIYQQLEDVVAKWIFRLNGYEDDRIVASMHQYITKDKDEILLAEMKNPIDTLRDIIFSSDIVEFSFDGLGSKAYDSLICPEFTAQLCSKLLDALHQFEVVRQQEDEKKWNKATGSLKLNSSHIDDEILLKTGIKIGRRVDCPIPFYSSLLKDDFQAPAEFNEALRNVLKVNNHSIQSNKESLESAELKLVESEIDLSYKQMCTLFELFGNSSAVSNSLSNNQLDENQSTQVNPTISNIQAGSLFFEINPFLNPTASFILQLSDYLSNNPESSDDSLDRSLAFARNALSKLDEAKTASAIGDFESAVSLLSEGLLDELECSDLVVPIHLRVQLLLDRAKYYSDLGALAQALEDIETVVSLDERCHDAYSLRSQLRMNMVRESEDYPDIIENLSLDAQQIAILPGVYSDIQGVPPLDILLHLAAEDAMKGGSSDISLAAAADDCAREMCRSSAKEVFHSRRLGNRLPDSGEPAAQNGRPLPREWLISSYLSGYELPSAAMQLFGAVTYQKQQRIAALQLEAIDEGVHATSRSTSDCNRLPPDHLLDREGEENGDGEIILRDKDVEAYRLLSNIVSLLEEMLPVQADLSEFASADSEIDRGSAEDALRNSFSPISMEHIPEGFVPKHEGDDLWSLVDFGVMEISVASASASASTSDAAIDATSTASGDPALPSHATATGRGKKALDSNLNMNAGLTCNGSSSNVSRLVDAFKESALFLGIALAESHGVIQSLNIPYTPPSYLSEKSAHELGTGSRDCSEEEEEEEEEDSVWEDISDDEEASEGGDSSEEEEEEEAEEEAKSDSKEHFGQKNSPKPLDEFEELAKTEVSGSQANTIHAPRSSTDSSDSAKAESALEVGPGSADLVNLVDRLDIARTFEDDQETNQSPELHSSSSSPQPAISPKLQARLLSIIGSIAYLMGDAVGAVQCFEASLFYDAKLVDTRIKLGALLVDMDESEKARSMLEICCSEDPGSPVPVLHLAEWAINQTDFSLSTEKLRQANRLISRGWEIDSGEHLVFFSSNPAEFRRLSSASLAEIHANIFALLGVSTFRQAPEKPEYAMSVIEEGLEKYPTSLTLLLCGGEIHAQGGDMVKAIGYFKKAALIYPSNPLPWMNAGRTYQTLGQLNLAMDHLRKAESIDGTLAMIQIDLAQLLRERNQVDEAVKVAENALEFAKQVSEIRDVLCARYITRLQQFLVPFC